MCVSSPNIEIPHTGNTRPSRTCVVQEYQFYTMIPSLYHELLSIPCGSEFSTSRKLGCIVATGSSLFSLGYMWVITVPAGADIS